ncbi:hypothetical protein LOZ66_003251 [Ophidiomyces ophidiicola]|nr:hypothetical protein LOZ66_003251 [Ophidiomyces ophidiicola]
MLLKGVLPLALLAAPCIVANPICSQYQECNTGDKVKLQYRFCLTAEDGNSRLDYEVKDTMTYWEKLKEWKPFYQNGSYKYVLTVTFNDKKLNTITDFTAYSSFRESFAPVTPVAGKQKVAGEFAIEFGAAPLQSCQLNAEF